MKKSLTILILAALCSIATLPSCHRHHHHDRDHDRPPHEGGGPEGPGHSSGLFPSSVEEMRGFALHTRANAVRIDFQRSGTHPDIYLGTNEAYDGIVTDYQGMGDTFEITIRLEDNHGDRDELTIRGASITLRFKVDESSRQDVSNGQGAAYAYKGQCTILGSTGTMHHSQIDGGAEITDWAQEFFGVEPMGLIDYGLGY